MMRLRAKVTRSSAGWKVTVRDLEGGVLRGRLEGVESWQAAIEHAERIIRNLQGEEIGVPYVPSYGPSGFWRTSTTHLGEKRGPGPWGHPQGPSCRDTLYDPEYFNTINQR